MEIECNSVFIRHRRFRAHIWHNWCYLYYPPTGGFSVACVGDDLSKFFNSIKRK